MCQDSNCNHDQGDDHHDQGDESVENAHSRQENKDLADISKYLEDDVLRNQTLISLPAFITEARSNTKAARLEREKAMSSIKVDKSHVDFLMTELEMSKVEAEKLLKSCQGNLELTLREFMKI